MTDDTNSFHPDAVAAMHAIEQAQGVVRFGPDGTIRDANDIYLSICGYRREDLIGQTIAILSDPKAPSMASSPEFWLNLRAGKTQSGEFKRLDKSGTPFWIHATYMPIMDEGGALDQVVAYVVDVSHRMRLSLDAIREVEALRRHQAVIEFTPDGLVQDANEVFLTLMGYALEDIKGHHHSMFMPRGETATPEYRQFWADLGAGQAKFGEFQRVNREGQPVWISGQYTPLVDERGRVLRVIKSAIDVTARRNAIDALIAGLGQLAAGDLTDRLSDAIGGDFSAVRDSFNATIDGLAEMVGEIRQRTEQMNEEAAAIASGAGDLARRGESQAASLEQTAAAVEEISGNITMTSNSARDADVAARETQTVVLNGAGVVAEAIAAIERIDEHTRKMGEFTRVIEGFAFQTNLLSINAAVEAARAGEVGRGFAVVANEVRNLAQQSATASQNIAELIAKSESEVRSGVRLARQAGIALDQIRSAVGGMVENMTSIAHATAEQSSGVHEVSGALAQLDSVNQANLVMSEQYAAAAATLFDQVEELARMMDRFQTVPADRIDHRADGPDNRRAAA